MARNYFFISDTHFGHEKTWSTFKNEKGERLRPFESTEEMDQHMIDCWNKVVGDNDVVWHLGDVVINRRYMKSLYALKGVKRLVRGNHDIFATKEYMEHFEEIYGAMKVGDYMCTHIPIHPESLSRWKANVHGHLHGKRVMMTDEYGVERIDPRYICMSVENVNYTPVPYEEVENWKC